MHLAQFYWLKAVDQRTFSARACEARTWNVLGGLLWRHPPETHTTGREIKVPKRREQQSRQKKVVRWMISAWRIATRCFPAKGKSTSGMKHGNLMLSRPMMQRSPCSEYISNKQVQPQVWTTHLVLLQWSFNGTGGGRPYPSNDNVNNIEILLPTSW